MERRVGSTVIALNVQCVQHVQQAGRTATHLAAHAWRGGSRLRLNCIH